MTGPIRSAPASTLEAQGKGAGYCGDGAGEQTLCLMARIVPPIGDGQGAGSIRVLLEPSQKGLNKVGLPHSLGPSQELESKTQGAGGAGGAWDGAVVSAARRNWGGPTITTPWQGASQLPQAGRCQGAGTEWEMRERNLRNAEAGWLCGEAGRRAGGFRHTWAQPPRSVLCLPAGRGVCV